MSRAVNANISVGDVETLCAKHKMRISTVEPLLSGGSRVVLLDPRDADSLRGLLKTKMIDGEVKRSPAHISRQPVPSSR
jgi:hypothetical protein